nr:ATP-binding protein [uncultured Sulfurimonas sp.]
MNSNKALESKNETFFFYIKKKIDELKKIVGVVDLKEPISFKISEFMQDVNSSLEALPQEYKDLYELKPADEKFFFGREEEIKTLDLAYENWQKERFVTCAIIGEKGCGVTSMLDAFSRKIPQTNILRVELKEKIYTNNSYFYLFNTLLNTKDIFSNKELIDFLNNMQETKVIILENLHHMFLKRVGGFDSMEMLFELISFTTKKILWIGAFTPNTWNYLDKTIAISNYFTSEILMKQLNYETIRDVIFKRIEHKDAKVEFLTNEEISHSKTFQDYDHDDKQSHLQEKFFKLLYKLSNGNISLALLYWIRAISIDEKSVLNVQEIDDFDYSFVKNLSSEALFTLQALVLHDGLSINDFAIVTHESLPECRKTIMPMLERGLLIQPHKKYNINPAIYKPVHDYLSSKNYIQ